jgi:hypothetical protein
VIAKFHAVLKPGGVWAFNTYDNRALWGRLFGSRWYTLVPNTSQIHNDSTLRRLIDEAGFDLVARRRDRPYASIERLLFVLLSQVSHGVLDKFFERVHFLNRLIIPVRAPDAFEYLCVKRGQSGPKASINLLDGVPPSTRSATSTSTPGQIASEIVA